MLPARMSFSSRRATICSEVRPSGDRHLMLHHLALDDGADHVAQARVLGNWYSPALSSLRALSANTPPMKIHGLVDHAFALPAGRRCRVMPRPRGMLTILSCVSGPGASNRLLPRNDGATADRQGQDQHRENGIADDHQRVALAP